MEKKLSLSRNSHLISPAFHWHSSRFLVQPKMSHSQCTGSYNWGPFLCPGEAAVRQLQAVHWALPVPDEEHASDFPLHQRRCHYTLRAHAEVKSHHHCIKHSAVLSYQIHAQPFTPTYTERLQPVSHTLWRLQCWVIARVISQYITAVISWSFLITHVKGNIEHLFLTSHYLPCDGLAPCPGFTLPLAQWQGG